MRDYDLFTFAHFSEIFRASSAFWATQAPPLLQITGAGGAVKRHFPPERGSVGADFRMNPSALIPRRIF
jgi:hypothetical protein